VTVRSGELTGYFQAIGDSAQPLLSRRRDVQQKDGGLKARVSFLYPFAANDYPSHIFANWTFVRTGGVCANSHGQLRTKLKMPARPQHNALVTDD
jgi:hypothetical protein